MPSSVTARIKSAPKSRPYTSLLAGVFAVIVVIVAGLVLWPGPATVRLGLPDRAFELEVARDQAARLKGLSGRDALPKDKGMLFTFEENNRPCMWMKDMRFPLDILWLDAQQRVVHMARNISPLTYPRTFCPRAPATYVIELNAGQTQAAHVYVGQRLSF